MLPFDEQRTIRAIRKKMGNPSISTARLKKISNVRLPAKRWTDRPDVATCGHKVVFSI
jgi:hypothetical protein